MTSDVGLDLLCALNEEIYACEKCSIAKTTRNKVPGEGMPNALIMSIAEAPGEEEEKTGRPFMGIAGKKWEEILDSIGLHRDYIHVCNAICCRPIGNKLSSDFHEVINCNPFLRRRIEIVMPKFIIIWGKPAFDALFGISNTSMKTIRSKNPYTYNGIKVFATYHPSFINRRASMSWESYNDLIMVKEYINNVDTG